MSNTVEGHGGTNFTVIVATPGGDDIHVEVDSTYREPGCQHVWTGSLSIENSKHLRLLLEEAEIKAKPAPTKAERIRAILSAGGNINSYGNLHASALRNVHLILDEDGPL